MMPLKINKSKTLLLEAIRLYTHLWNLEGNGEIDSTLLEISVKTGKPINECHESFEELSNLVENLRKKEAFAYKSWLDADVDGSEVKYAVYSAIKKSHTAAKNRLWKLKLRIRNTSVDLSEHYAG